MVDVAAHLFMGTVAGMASVAVDYPLDTLKTRMQAQDLRKPLQQSRRTVASSSHHLLSSRYGGSALSAAAVVGVVGGPCLGSSSGSGGVGYVQCVREVLASHGVAGFYRGVSVPLVAQGLENAIIFSVFTAAEEYWRPFFARRRGGAEGGGDCAPIHRGELWAAAASAGAAVSLVLTPVEFVKGNMQVAARAHCGDAAGGLLHAPQPLRVRCFCAKIRQQHGWSGFFTGFTGTALRAVPGNMAYFMTYRQLMHLLTAGGGDGPATWQCVAAGGVSGAAYWTIMYPCDVAKTRMQVMAGGRCLQGSVGPSATAPRPTFTGALTSAYREGGMRALYSGWTVTAVRAFSSSAVVFTVYEKLLAHRGRVVVSSSGGVDVKACTVGRTAASGSVECNHALEESMIEGALWMGS